ncbi:MAG TPA: hypothetical protein VFZ86_15640, partial [Thermoleophilia bacterium]|nr:hypothetical protein [Thermoleophilia bacterium]
MHDVLSSRVARDRVRARARLTARMAVSRARGRPHTLSHLVTARCNGSCATCLWRAGAGGSAAVGATAAPAGERAAGDGRAAAGELGTAAVRRLYAEAGRAGMAQLVVWGGEPLLRRDLPELLLAARRSGLFVTLISNGWFAAE